MQKGKRVLSLAGTVLLAVVLLAVVLSLCESGLLSARAGGAGDPDPGTVVGIKSVSFATGSTAISATTYYSAGATNTGYDTRFWHSADVFVTADVVTTTNAITITPQWSADGTNWVAAKYKAEGWVLPLSHSTTITNASGVTNTTTSTHVVTFASSAAVRSSEWVTYQVALFGSGSDYVAIPLHGNYLRLKAEVYTATYLITPTLQVVLRNDGGR